MRNCAEKLLKLIRTYQGLRKASQTVRDTRIAAAGSSTGVRQALFTAGASTDVPTGDGIECAALGEPYVPIMLTDGDAFESSTTTNYALVTPEALEHRDSTESSSGTLVRA